MVMTTQILIPYKRPHAFYSPAAHITSITTFHSSRPSFPPRLSCFSPCLFLLVICAHFQLCHCALCYFRIKVIKWIFTEMISLRGGVGWVSCGEDNDKNEKREEEVGRETNQKHLAAWLTLISSSS